MSGSFSGTFKLIPLTPGSVKADNGTFTFSIKPRPSVLVSGQRVTTYGGADELTSKRGTLEIRSVTRSTEAGGEYLVGSGTWSAAGGTKAYAGLRANGMGSSILTPRKVIFSRYEGFVSSS